MKKVLGILFIIIIFSIVFNTVSVLAFGGGFNYGNVSQNGGESNLEKLKTPINRFVNTIFLVLQIASVAGVIIAGVKYMFSSANQKAEYKKGLVMIVIGLVLVFGASTVARFVVNAFNDATTVSVIENNKILHACYKNVTNI